MKPDEMKQHRSLYNKEELEEQAEWDKMYRDSLP